MTRTRSRRPLRVLVVAGLIAAGLTIPATGAQAATGTMPFKLANLGGSNNSVGLGNVVGTVTATAGSTSARYNLFLCGMSTYQNAKVTLAAGTGTVTHSVSYQNCQRFSGTLTSGSAFSSAKVTLTSGTLYPGNTYQERTSTETVVFPRATPAASPTPVTAPFTAAVRGQSRSLGLATGTVTATKGGTTATYSVRLCGQSTYPGSSVTIVAGTATATHSVSYSNCQTFTGTLNSTKPFYEAKIAASGSTFQGRSYETYTDNEVVYF